MHSITKKILTLSTALILPLSLGGCGTETQDRVLSGAGLGTAAGAATYAVFGGPVITGMAVGAAAGAITGGVTSPDNIYLGKPLWKPNDPEPQRRNVGNAQW